MVLPIFCINVTNASHKSKSALLVIIPMLKSKVMKEDKTFSTSTLFVLQVIVCQVFGAFHNTAVLLRQLNLAVKSRADFYYCHSIECCILVEDIQIFKTGTADVQFCFPTTFQ